MERLNAIQSCVDTNDRLCAVLEAHKESISKCFSGEVERTYDRMIDATITEMEEIRKRLLMLQSE